MNTTSPCCGPSRDSVSSADESHELVNKCSSTTLKNYEGLVDLPGGSFLMGSQDEDSIPEDGEGPVRETGVEAFRIAQTAVTNAEFVSFIKETNYETDAERYGCSFVFEGLLMQQNQRAHEVVGKRSPVPWWRTVPNACWNRPEGDRSSIDERMEHPVVHVSWNDAVAYCDWAQVRLPTEIEWEYAARGGLTGKRLPWGDDLTPRDQHLCNIWQGEFPVHNTCEDGYYGTAPVAEFEPNGFGLYNMAGNVWEWCSDVFATRARPESGNSDSPRVMKGGSYLCHFSYCNRYRVAARYSNTPNSSTGNCGFRVVR